VPWNRQCAHRPNLHRRRIPPNQNPDRRRRVPQQVTLPEVEYDYQATCAAIIEKGLPPIFAGRLAKGLEYTEKANDPAHVCER